MSARRSGSADLPLHGGRVPPWLGERMTRLGAVIAEAIVLDYGRDELLRRLAHPFWFQSFGAVMGMDWHSSGITTSVIGALKRGLEPLAGELGLHVCGGRGEHSRKTPHELVGDRRAGRLRRRGAGDREPAGRQGRQRRRAGRLRPLSARLHRRRRRPLGRGAAGDERRRAAGAPLPLAVRRADRASSMRRTRDRRRRRRGDRQPDRPPRRRLARTPGRLLGDARPDGVAREIAALERRRAGAGAAAAAAAASRHAGASRRARRATSSRAACTATSPPRPTAGRAISPSCCWSRASARAPCGRWRMVAEVVHGAPCRFTDPARFSFAHGGKDRHPFPVPLKVYDQTIAVHEVGGRARPSSARRGACRDPAARRAGPAARAQRAGPSVEALIAEERAPLA